MAQPDVVGTVKALIKTIHPANAANFKWHADLPLTDLSTPLIASIMYLMMVLFMFQSFVDRPPVRGLIVKVILLAHNLFLSLGSAVLLVLILKEMYATYKESGVEALICDVKRVARHTTGGPVLYYFYIFYLSKFYEFIDTVFVIIKKHELIPLHWYHHVTTLLLVWDTVLHGVAINWLPISTNLLVHTVMYFYYALATVGAKPGWPMLVTILQIVQFVVDLGFFAYGFHVNVESGWNCAGPVRAWVFGAAILSSFLLLFIQLFLKRYVFASKKPHAADHGHGKRKSAAKQE